jgi:hypothetical protein
MEAIASVPAFSPGQGPTVTIRIGGGVPLPRWAPGAPQRRKAPLGASQLTTLGLMFVDGAVWSYVAAVPGLLLG